MQKDTFGGRLKEERNRLGLNQDDFAAIGGVKKLAQVTYEQDKRHPDAGYLISVASIGVDVGYVLFGKVAIETLDKDESELVTGFRQLDARGKVGILAMLEGLTIDPGTKNNTVIKGKVGQVVQGDQDVRAPIKINVGSRKTSKKQ